MSLPTLLILLALGVLIATLVLVGMPLIARLRAQEGFNGNFAGSDSGLSAINELGQRIETLVNQQQEQGETQRQHLAQQIDSVQQTIGEQRVLVDSLRSEMRHESKRRDHELDEIRTQIASIQQVLPALGEASVQALPPAPQEADPVDEIPESFETESFETEAFVIPEASLRDIAHEAPPVESAPADELAEVSDEPTAEDVFTEVVDPFALTPIDTFDETSTAEPSAPEVEDTWTADWSDADLTDAMFEEAAPTPTPELDIPQEETQDETIAAEPADLDVFTNVSMFEEVDAPQDSLAEAAPQAPAFEVTPPPPEADSTSYEEPPMEDALFDELEVAEMSFVDPAPTPHAFDPEEAAREIDAIEASLADILPAAPPAIEFVEDVQATEAPDTGVFMDAAMPDVNVDADATASEPDAPEPMGVFEPVVPSEPSPDSASADDTFIPTPFIEDAVPTADPLAFEETYVPTPVDNQPDADADDVFASWSPSSFETEAPPPPPLSFTEAPAEAPQETTLEATALEPKTTEPTSPVDLSTFEDWGLDPEPVQTSHVSWAREESAPSTFEAWTPAPQAPAPQPQPTAPAPPPDSETPSATAWVVRNENLEPTAPPAAVEMTSTPPIADEVPAADAATVYEEAPVHVAPRALDDISATVASPAAPAPSAPSPGPDPAPMTVEPTAPTPGPLPEGFERLSVLPSIDDDLERALHLAGVSTLDEMARWGRTDARRIASQVGVSEDTVLNHWVFEAQTALFERFTQQVSS